MLKKISEKLDAILKEEDDKNCTRAGPKSSNRNHQRKYITTKKDLKFDGLEDTEKYDITFPVRCAEISKSSVPLFPSDASEHNHSGKKTKFDRMTGHFDERYNKQDVISPFIKELQSSEGFVEAKMVELSKKIRQLNSQLISTQNKLRIAETRVNVQESCQSETDLHNEVSSEDEFTKLKTEFKELNDKFQACNAKLCEARNTVQQHKHEIKLLHKALANEVGENYSLHNVTSDGWRGRAQQICSLQQKVIELTEKLSLTSIPSIEKSLSAVQSFEKSQDKERIALLTKEVEDLKAQLSDLKSRGDQARARVNVLSADIVVLKNKYETLTAKNDEDEKLINTLTNKLTSFSKKTHDKEVNMAKQYDDQLVALNTELKQERVKTEQYQKIICERDENIKKLEEKIHHGHFQNNSHPSFLQNETYCKRPASSSSSDRPATQQSLSTCSSYNQNIEVERLRLMELVTIQNRRLEEERKTLDKIQDQLRSEKQKSAKLESKVNKLELEKVGKNYRRPTGRVESFDKQELETTKDNCALLKERCLALESRLERLRCEKEEDSRIYVRMVEEARTALRDQIRKSSSCSASS